MNRIYADVSAFRSPYSSPNLTLTGLGAWPAGRTYADISDFQAPYDAGMYNPRSLFGLGQVPPAATNLPPKFRRYVASGESMGTLRRDLSAASSQVPRLVYGVLMVGSAYLGYRSYKRWKKGRKKGGKG